MRGQDGVLVVVGEPAPSCARHSSAATVAATVIELQALLLERGIARSVAGVASMLQQIREADEAIKRANTDLDDTIRQLGELGLLGRPASQQTLEKLTNTLSITRTPRASDSAVAARATSSALRRSTSSTNRAKRAFLAPQLARRRRGGLASAMSSRTIGSRRLLLATRARRDQQGLLGRMFRKSG
jgi:hypothetical protein